MKKMKLIMSALVLSTCILFGGLSTPIVVQAEETEQAGTWMTYISMYSNDLTISDTGVASISGLVRGKSGVTSTYVKCTLQMSISGDWVDVKSWEDSSTGIGATVGETYQLSSRGTYRVYMVCRANTEEKTLISAYRTY